MAEQDQRLGSRLQLPVTRRRRFDECADRILRIPCGNLLLGGDRRVLWWSELLDRAHESGQDLPVADLFEFHGTWGGPQRLQILDALAPSDRTDDLLGERLPHLLRAVGESRHIGDYRYPWL